MSEHQAEQSANGAVKEPDATAGSGNSPHAPSDEQMSAGDENTVVSRSQPGEGPPPAANQGDAEPVPSAPEESPQASGGSGGAGSDAQVEQAASAGDASREPKDQGTPAREIMPDADAGARQMQAGLAAPAVAGSGVPAPGGTPNAPGDSAGVPVPSVHAAAGTSEEVPEPDGVRITSIVSPGKPDGEVDTRS